MFVRKEAGRTVFQGEEGGGKEIREIENPAIASFFSQCNLNDGKKSTEGEELT